MNVGYILQLLRIDINDIVIGRALQCLDAADIHAVGEFDLARHRAHTEQIPCRLLMDPDEERVQIFT